MGEARGHLGAYARLVNAIVWGGVTTALLAAGSAAQAAPYGGPAYEPFDYGTVNDAANDTNDGDLVNNTGGSGFGGAWTGGTNGSILISSGSLTYPGLTSQGNRTTVDAATPNSSQSIFRSLGPTVDSGSFYFSFLVKRNNDSNRTFNVALFTGTGSERFSVGQYGTTTTSSNGNFGIVYANSGNIINATSPVAVGTGQTHLLVGRIDFDVNGGTNERVRIYVDPSTAAEPGAAYIDDTSTSITPFDTFRPFGGNATTSGNIFPAVSVDYDEFHFGGTYESLFAAVPEPTTLGLAGIAALGLVGSRRRR